MRIRKIDRRIERDIIIGMITDRSYLAQIRGNFNTSLLKNKYIKTIAKWVIDFFDAHNQAPFAEIEAIYNYNQKRGNVDEEDVDLNALATQRFDLLLYKDAQRWLFGENGPHIA